MKCVPGFTGRTNVLLVVALTAALFSTTNAAVQSGQVLVQAVKGGATYSTGGSWEPLQENITLTRGATIKTGPDATVDLILQYNGTVLRLTPNSALSFDKLTQQAAGEEVITETSLNLLSGSIIGSQRKLATPSTFEIHLPGGVARIKGTEYLVRADGAVTCLSGSVNPGYPARQVNLERGGSGQLS